jgi:vanillate O-demethylase ferredoxin subunit
MSRIVIRDCHRLCARIRLRRLPAVSCRAGLCRRCEVEALSGESEHREYASISHEQSSGKSLMILALRATSDELMIDL